jgi:uncharacterized protein (DUF1499 family)
VSRIARGAAWLGLAAAGLAALALLSAGPGTRLGWWHFSTGFRVLRAAAWIGGAAGAVSLLAAGLAGAGRQWRTVAVAGAGVLLGLVAFGVPAVMARRAAQVPPIHDITTDPDDPPAFVAILALRRSAPNPAEYGGPAVAARQRQGYPDLRPVAFAEPPRRVFAAALAAAGDAGWQVVSAEPAEGRLEATDTTRWFGFTDDVVVRVRPAGDCTRVDVRSVSRVGRSDLGTNAARIRRLLQALARRPLAPCPRAG